MSLLSTIVSTLYISSGMVLFNNIPWSFIFFLTQLFGIRLYILQNKEQYLRIQKRIGKKCSHLTDNDKGYGYSIGYWYILSLESSIRNEGDSYKVWLLATENSYEALTKDIEDKNNNKEIIQEKTSLTIYNRTGSYYNIWFKKRTIKIPDFKPRENQQIIIDEIIRYQNRNKHSVVLLHGNPGSGKSMIGLLIASQLKGSYCNTLVPWQPGDTLAELYSEIEPSEDNPLILALEEIDGAILQINNVLPKHKAIPILIYDKSSWCNLMDSINRGMYPNLIIILTSNKPPQYFNNLDEAYIREGRVDLIFKVS